MLTFAVQARACLYLMSPSLQKTKLNFGNTQCTKIPISVPNTQCFNWTLFESEEKVTKKDKRI